MHMIKFLKPTVCIQALAIILIIILCCLNFDKLNYIAVLNDEFGYWSNAVSVVGYNWKELIAETPYYAWGYSLWLIPIILILQTPELWYKAAILLNIFLLICSYFLCCSVGKRIFSGIKENTIYIVGFLVIIYPSNIIYSQVAWSETLLYFLMWLATYMMVKLDEKFSYLKSIVLVVVLIYMYMVHARSIGIVGVGILCLILLLIKNKKSILNIVFILGVFVLGYILNNCIKQYQLSELWCNSTVSNMNNVSLNSHTVLAYFTKIFDNIRLFLESLGGKIIYSIVGTGAIILISLVQFIKEEFINVKTKKFFISNNITKIWCVFSFLISWILCSLQMLSWTERKDIIVYSRYMENAMGPILLIGILYAITKIKETRIALGLALVILLVGLRSVYWRVLEAESFFNSICSPVFGAFYDFFNKDALKAFACIGVVCFLIFIIFFVASFVKKDLLRCGIIFSCLLLYFGFLIDKGNIYMNESRDFFDSSTVPLKTIILDKYDTQEIYYIKNESDPYSVKPKYLQFTIPDKNIHLIDNENLGDNLSDLLVLVNPSDCESLEEIEGKKDMELVLETSQLNLYYIK